MNIPVFFSSLKFHQFYNIKNLSILSREELYLEDYKYLPNTIKQEEHQRFKWLMLPQWKGNYLTCYLCLFTILNTFDIF